MLVRRYILLAVCLLHCLLASAQVGAKPALTLTAEGDSLLLLRFEWPGSLGLRPADPPYAMLVCEGMHFAAGSVGAPALPTASTLVRLPKGSRLEVAAIEGEHPFTLGTAAPLAPITDPWGKDSPPPDYHAVKEIYASGSWYRGGNPVDIDDLGAMGPWQLFRLTVRPAAYNPQSNTLRCYTSLDARLAVRLDASSASPLAIADQPQRMLVVSRPRFRQTLQPFVAWKRQLGLDVVELYADTNDRDSVKALMRPFFDDATPLRLAPAFILLVGDYDDLRPFLGTTRPTSMGNHVTDFFYSDFTGDHLPDALLGRWPVADTIALGNLIAKTIGYEQGRSLDTLALGRALLVAGEEHASIAPTTTNGQVNYLGTEVMRRFPATDTLCYRNPASASQLDDILRDLSLGAAFLNYTAHCRTTGWTSPAATAATFDTLAFRQPLLFVNNCCRSNDFSGDGFGEQLLRMADGGAIGVIGATNETLWAEDYYWAVGPKTPFALNPAYDSLRPGAFDRWLAADPMAATQGSLLHAGNLAVTAFGSPYSGFYWEIYCLLGDPSLRPWLGLPQRATLAVADTPRNGQGSIALSGTPHALVAAMQADTLLGIATLDSLGHAVIHLRRALDTMPLVITVSGPGLIPLADTLGVATDMALAVALRNVSISDTLVRCTVHNVGTQRLDSLSILLTQKPDDTLAGATIGRQMAVIDFLMPGDTAAVALPVAIATIGTHPLWQASLLAATDTLLADLTLRHPASTPYPTLTLRLLTADGLREVRRLMPATPYRLVAHISGNYDSLCLEAEPLPGGTLTVTGDTLLHFTTPDSLCHLRIAASLHQGRWNYMEQHWLSPGERIEDFEQGFDRLPWDRSCRMPWVIDSTVSHSGRQSIRSAPIGHNETSDLLLTVNLPYDDTISFWVKVSSEPQTDQMTFSIDGLRYLPVVFGEAGWYRVRYFIPAGKHTLRWRYAKDHSVSEGSDCVWVDDISLPMSYWDTGGSFCTTATLGIADRGSDSLRIYPNPTATLLHIETPCPMEVRLLDVVGRQVAHRRIDGSTLWHLPALADGVYLLVASDSQSTIYRKFIIHND